MSPDQKYYPRDDASFERMQRAVENAVDVSTRFPRNPFKGTGGRFDFCQFDWAVSGAFGHVLRELAFAHQESAVVAVAIDPSPEYFIDNYGSYPAFSLGIEIAKTDFFSAVDFSPGGDATGSIHIAADVVAITGPEGSWAVWAERDWEIAVAWTTTRLRPRWTEVGVPFVTLADALRDFTGASSGSLEASEHQAFLKNFE